MDTLFLCNTKTLKEKINTKVFAGDNKITKINVQIPDNIGGYPKRECEYNLRAIIPEGNLSYMIDPLQPYFYITNDITEKAQIVKLMMIITHAGNVIGRTNTVDLIVNEPAEAPDPPLTPREEFDTVIREQRQTIQEQSQTISTQGETITQQGEQITELNSEVSTLEGTVSEQQATITRQNQTIDQLNSRVPALQQLDPINPSGIQQTYNPQSPNIGFPQVIVNPVTAEGINFHPEYYKEGEECVGKVGTYNPFPEQSYGGVYVTGTDNSGNPTKLLITNLNGDNSVFYFPFNVATLKSYVQECVFKDCENYTRFFTGGIFNTSVALKHIEFSGVKVINAEMCKTTPNLRSIIIGSGVETIESTAFGYTAIEEIYISSTLYSLSGYCFYYNRNLKTINIPSSLQTISAENPFHGDTALEFVTIENGFNCNNLNLSASTRYSVETILSWLEALADRTGLTAYTLIIGTANINKLTAEQIAIATNKNWNLT